MIDHRDRQRAGGVDRVVGSIGETDVRCELVVERGSLVELLLVVPTETDAGKAAVLLRIGLLLFAIGVADAVAGGEAPPLRVRPRIPDTGMQDVPATSGVRPGLTRVVAGLAGAQPTGNSRPGATWKKRSSDVSDRTTFASNLKRASFHTCRSSSENPHVWAAELPAVTTRLRSVLLDQPSFGGSLGFSCAQAGTTCDAACACGASCSSLWTLT